MKLRISIILLAVSLLVNAGCSTVKTAYNGTEKSHFTNPAKVTAMNNQAQGLAPVAEAPALPPPAAANPGGTGSGMMTGMSTQAQFPSQSNTSGPTWGGDLSVR